VLGVPLERTVVEEGAAYGAALLSGVATGVFRDAREAVEACVCVRDEIEPDDGWLNRYAEGYERFQALYPALREVR
jgi:xylulokinase